MKLSFLSYNQRQKKCKGPGNLSAKKKTCNLSHAREIKTSSMKVRENWWSAMLVSEWIRKRPFLILTCSRNFYNLNVLNETKLLVDSCDALLLNSLENVAKKNP